MRKATRRSLERGFTLLEIMVVVVIIGLLAAIVVPNLVGNIDTAQINRAKSDIRQLENALTLFRLKNSSFPTTQEGLQALVANPNETRFPNWQQELQRLPKDPWNGSYQYRIPGQHGGNFDVFTLGRDGREGGEGLDADIGNWNLE